MPLVKPMAVALALAVVAAPVRAQDAAPPAPPADAPPSTTTPPTTEPAPATQPATTEPAPAETPPPAEAPPAEATTTTEPPAEPAPTSEAPPADEPAVADATLTDEPSIEERRIVAYVATGVAVASLAVGVTFGILAQQQYQCVADVVACNAGAEDPIVGAELFDARAEVEHKALIADMAYLFAAASALVAVTGYLRGFVFTGEEDTAEAGGAE